MIALRVLNLAIGLAIGVFVPFISVNLASRGFGPAQIGLVASLGALGFTIAVPVWGHLADVRLGRPQDAPGLRDRGRGGRRPAPPGLVDGGHRPALLPVLGLQLLVAAAERRARGQCAAWPPRRLRAGPPAGQPDLRHRGDRRRVPLRPDRLRRELRAPRRRRRPDRRDGGVRAGRRPGGPRGTPGAQRHAGADVAAGLGRRRPAGRPAARGRAVRGGASSTSGSSRATRSSACGSSSSAGARRSSRSRRGSRRSRRCPSMLVAGWIAVRIGLRGLFAVGALLYGGGVPVVGRGRLRGH